MAKVTLPKTAIALRSDTFIASSTEPSGYKQKITTGKFHLRDLSSNAEDAGFDLTSCGFILNRREDLPDIELPISKIPVKKLCKKCFRGLILEE